MEKVHDLDPHGKLFKEIMSTDMLIPRLECCKICFAYGIDENGTPFQVFKGTREEMMKILKKVPKLIMKQSI